MYSHALTVRFRASRCYLACLVDNFTAGGTPSGLRCALLVFVFEIVHSGSHSCMAYLTNSVKANGAAFYLCSTPSGFGFREYPALFPLFFCQFS